MDKKGFRNLGFARVDTDRLKRRGFPEVIYSPGKAREHIKAICATIIKKKQDLILTRLDKGTYMYLKKFFPRLQYKEAARTGYLVKKRKVLARGSIVVISAGTADIPVAEEAAVIAQLCGSRVTKLYDVGVAGVHRLMHNLELIRKASVVIVVAGMEGALASLVGGLVSAPVVAVPTSCGYGASFAGLSALLTMLNSCSPGVAVVNIDNGFGAGYFAALINK